MSARLRQSFEDLVGVPRLHALASDEFVCAFDFQHRPTLWRIFWIFGLSFGAIWVDFMGSRRDGRICWSSLGQICSERSRGHLGAVLEFYFCFIFQSVTLNI